MTRILLTGANGQLGWEVARRAPGRGLEVTAFDRAGLDITDPAAVRLVILKAAPRVVVNAAAYTAVDKAETETNAAFAVNRDGAAVLAEACAAADVPLIHVSTDYVFDGRAGPAWGEDDAVLPLNAYGRSKLAGEDAIRGRWPRHVILRTAWVYGLHGHNFVKTMLRLAGERDTLRVVADQIGSPTYAADLAEATLHIARALASGTGGGDRYGTFHCTNAGQTSWCGFARRIFATARPHLSRTPDVQPITTADFPTPARRPANSVLDGRRLRATYGLEMRPWEDALDDMLQSHFRRRSESTAAE